MGTPNNSYAREASRNLRDGIEARREAEERDRKRDIAENGSLQANARTRMQRLVDTFDALEVGDSLGAFDINGVVRKKNRKSVVSECGIKWTRHELTGVK